MKGQSVRKWQFVNNSAVTRKCFDSLIFRKQIYQWVNVNRLFYFEACAALMSGHYSNAF